MLPSAYDWVPSDNGHAHNLAELFAILKWEAYLLHLLRCRAACAWIMPG